MRAGDPLDAGGQPPGERHALQAVPDLRAAAL